jgi:hypothetical protein
VGLGLVQYVLHNRTHHGDVVRVIFKIIAAIHRLILNNRLCWRKFRPSAHYSGKLYWGKDDLHILP